MAQEINEVGILQKMTDQNFVFKKQEFNSITIVPGEYVSFEIIKSSDEGSKTEIKEVSYNKFEQIEDVLWDLINPKEG